MKITKRQLRKLIIETFFVNPEGEAIDLSAGDQPLFTDDRVKKLINHPDENIRNMARQSPEDYKQALNLAAYGYGDVDELTPEEERIQDFHDEFGVDSDYGYEHVTRDDQPETDWYGLIEQLKPIVDVAIEDAIASGITDDAELIRIMSNLPAYKALYRRIDREAGWETEALFPEMRTLADDAMIRNDINPLGRFV